MKYQFIFIIYIICLFTATSKAQTIHGYVEDQKTGERLPGAHIWVPGSPVLTTSNSYGFFSLAREIKDSIVLQCSYMGYQTNQKTVTANTKMPFVLHLQPSTDTIKEVVVTPGTMDKQEGSVSWHKLSSVEINRIPALLGEKDVLKAMQFYPGIQGGSEGSSELHIRGGSPDQNLVLLDDVPLYYTQHLTGLISTFNPYAIKQAKIMKAGFPARYGGRLSGVIDLRTKEGNQKEVSGVGKLGIISSSLAVEGPIKKDTSSFYLSYRRSLLDLLFGALQMVGNNRDWYSEYVISDINGKVNYKPDKKNRLYLSLFYGFDRSGIRNLSIGKAGFNNRNKWGNKMASLRWNHVFNPKWFSNITVSGSKYSNRQNIDVSEEDRSIEMEKETSISNWQLRWDLDFYPGEIHHFTGGLHTNMKDFTLGRETYEESARSEITVTDSTGNYQQFKTYHAAVYIQDEFDITDRLVCKAGIRSSYYHIKDKGYLSLQPRFYLNYRFTRWLRLNASYDRMQQNLHLLTNSAASLPWDIWVPATVEVPPQESQQMALSAHFDLLEDKFTLKMGGYYKKFTNLVSVAEGFSIYGDVKDWQGKIEANGLGYSKGLELMIEKNEGKWQGFLSYTLSKSTRKFENINFGDPYPYKYDRRHYFNATLQYNWKPHINVSANWVYYTGHAMTFPVGKYPGNGQASAHNITGWPLDSYYFDYISKNNYRIPDYHRLDMNAQFIKKKPNGTRIWEIGLYNTYARNNPFMIIPHFNDINNDGYGKITLKQVSVFNLIPSVSYIYKF